MTKRESLNGKPYAGTPHVRFDEGASAPKEPRRNALLHNRARLMLMTATAFAGTAFGAVRTNTILSGKSDWTSPDSYADSTYAPGENAEARDVVIIPKDATVRLNASTDSASLARVKNLGQILLASTTSRFEIDVAENEEVDIPVSISGYKYVPNIDYQFGPVVKTGKGTLSLSSVGIYGSALDYYTSFIVSAGVLKIQQGFSSYSSTQLGRITVEKDAVFYLPYKTVADGGMVYIKSLSGEGMITNAVKTTVYISGVSNSPYNDYAEFSGSLNGNFDLRINNSDTQSLTGDSSSLTGQVRFEQSNTRMSKLGVKSVGSGKGNTSSLGLLTGGESPEFYFLADGGELEYLGTGGETTRGFVFYGPEGNGRHPVVMNAGAHGGLEFKGHWQRQYSTKGGQNLILTGSNTEVCVINNTISDNTESSNANGRGHTLYIRKEGTGTWRMGKSEQKAFASGISVDEGVLQYTTLAEKGGVCSLGVSTNLTDGTIGTCDTNEEHRVSYAVRLGGKTLSGESKTSGRLEYVGEDLGFTSSREVAVAGAGGFRQNGNTQVMYRGGVYGISGDDMTLYLDGDSAKENRIKDISDGTQGGKLSVVKEGSGNWFLEGDLTFSGNISVKGGTLTICKPTRYTWYRWTITSLYPSGNIAKPYTTWKDGIDGNKFIRFHELGLFDSDGKNLVSGFEVDSDAVFGEYDATLRKGCAQIQTQPGVSASPATQDITQGDVTSNVVLSLERAFDEKYTGWSTWGVKYASTLRPVQNNPNSWFSVVMRLRDGMEQVAGLDFANVSGGWTTDWNSCISNFMVEASLDGVTWNVLTNVDAAAVHYDGGMWSCQGGYANGEEAHTGTFANSFPNGTPHYKWYPVAGAPDVLPSVLDSVGTVSVSGGGVLRLEGDGDVMLSDVCVDAASGGTIDGFSFAETGTFSIINAPSEGSAELPLNILGTDGVSKLASWNLSVNGKATTRRKVVVSGNRLTLMSTGFIMVLR